MHPAITLESVAKEFDQWRSSRTKQGHIPGALWVKALDLIERYTTSQVSKSLRVSHAQIKAKLPPKTKSIAGASSSFVELSIPVVSSKDKGLICDYAGTRNLAP